MQAKLGEQIEDYVILGACNPPLALQALDTDRQIAGRLMVSLTKQSELKPIADEAGRRLDTVLAALASDAKRG